MRIGGGLELGVGECVCLGIHGRVLAKVDRSRLVELIKQRWVIYLVGKFT